MICLYLDYVIYHIQIPNNTPFKLNPCVSNIKKEVMMMLMENPKDLSWRMLTKVPERYPRAKKSLPIRNRIGYPRA